MTPADYAKANCRGVNASLMFPDRGEDIDDAKAVCQGCAIRDACLEEALAHNEQWGVWGGASVNERKAIRKARRAFRRGGRGAA